MATLDEILRTEAELEALAKEISREQDVERIRQIAHEIQQRANEILEMGRALDLSLAAARRCGTRSPFTRSERGQLARATCAALALALDSLRRDHLT